MILKGGVTVTEFNPTVIVQSIYKAIIEKQSTQDHTLEIILQNIMRHTIVGDNNITTHYVEDGINYEDVTTTNPLTITVQGWMAEIHYNMNPAFQWLLTQIVQTANVPIIGGFIATELSSIEFIINLLYEKIRDLIFLYNKYIIRKLTNNKSGYDDSLIEFDESKPLGYQTAVLENLRQARIPISLTIPRVGVFHEMCLKNYEWDQDKSYYQSKVTINFQQLRRTNTVLTRLTNSTVNTRQAEQTSIATPTLGENLA